MRREMVRQALCLAAAVVSLVGCSNREQRYESVCQIVRKQAVEVDDKGVTQQVDLELEWDPCPGDQVQIVRGDKDFAACLAGQHEGDYVSVRVRHWWDDRGYYRWDIDKIGDCTRTIEPESEGSYEKSQECSDKKIFGVLSGFECNRRPFRRLVAVCPWMARN